VPEAVIIAGPNGAGKTTFAGRYFSDKRRHWAFVNADEIARNIADGCLPQALRDMRAARAMLERIDALVEARADFIVETTLASLSYAQKIAEWKRCGYAVSLIYLRLPSVEHSIIRVRRRLEAGGHGIPEESIRRRFSKSMAYLENIYKPIVDEWYIWDSLEEDFALAEAWDRP
jgi:predicted ABC-type ATPase